MLGVANSADEATAPLIRAYVSRLVQTEEARPVEQDAPAPTPKKEAWEPKITKSSYDAMQTAKQDTVPATPPTVAEQAAAAVARVVKPPEAANAPTSEDVCEVCGAAVPKQQAKLSMLFMNKTLCKKCQAEASP